MTACRRVSQETNRVYTGVLGPVAVVPYTHERVRGIGLVGVIGVGCGWAGESGNAMQRGAPDGCGA